VGEHQACGVMQSTVIIPSQLAAASEATAPLKHMHTTEFAH